MFFELKNTEEIVKDGFTAYRYNLKEEISEFTSLFVDVDGAHDKEYVKTSHRLYFVVQGNGKFWVGGKEKTVRQYDVIAIPPMTAYYYDGKMKLFEINFPGTGPEDSVKVD